MANGTPTEEDIINQTLGGLDDTLKSFGEDLLKRAELFEENSEEAEMKDEKITETLDNVDRSLNNVDKSIKKTLDNQAKKNEQTFNAVDKSFNKLFPQFSMLARDNGVLSASLKKTSDGLDDVSGILTEEGNPWLELAARGAAKTVELASDFAAKTEDSNKETNKLIEKAQEKPPKTSVVIEEDEEAKAKEVMAEKRNNKQTGVLYQQLEVLKAIHNLLEMNQDLQLEVKDELLGERKKKTGDDAEFIVDEPPVLMLEAGTPIEVAESPIERVDSLLPMVITPEQQQANEHIEQIAQENRDQSDLIEEANERTGLEGLQDQEDRLENQRQQDSQRPTETPRQQQEESKGLFGGLLELISAPFKGIFTTLGKVFKPIFSLGKKLAKFGFIISAVIGGFTGLLKVEEIFGPNADIWQTIAGALAGAIDGLTFGLLEDLFGVTLTDIAKFIDMLGKDFFGTLEKVWEAILNVDWAAVALTVWNKINEYIVEPLLDFGGFLLDKLEEFWDDTILPGLKSIGNTIVDKFNEYIIDPIKDFGTLIKDTFNKYITDPISSIFDSLVKGLGEIPIIGKFFKDEEPETKTSSANEKGLFDSITTGLTSLFNNVERPQPVLVGVPATATKVNEPLMNMMESSKRKMNVAQLEREKKEMVAEQERMKKSDVGADGLTQNNNVYSPTTNILSRPLDARNLSKDSLLANQKQYGN